MSLQGKEILLGVCGAIASYKALELVRRIRDQRGNVRVVMTKAATEFVGPLSFQSLSGRPVALNLFDQDAEDQIDHIAISEGADIFLIAPATANFIGKMAQGIADDYLSTLYLAANSPVLIAPAMNNRMWEHPAVQDNLKLLRQRGVMIIPPEEGYLACGTQAIGRLPEVSTIMQVLKEKLSGNKFKSLQGYTVLVTAGPTRERIDAVRYISNYSSGKMGYALAAGCQKLGATVCLVSGPTALSCPEGVELIKVESTTEMLEAVMRRADKAKLIIKCAAVCDYQATEINPQKNKKKGDFILKLKEGPDILRTLGQNKKKNTFLVGFAAESENLLENAQKKLKEKNLDLIVANNILEEGAGFQADTNKVWLIDNLNVLPLPLMTKKKTAEKIIENIICSTKWIGLNQG